MFNRVVALFQRNGWNFHPVEGQTVLETGFEAHHSKVPLHVQVFEDRDALSVVGRSSTTVQTDRIDRAAELLMRANLSLTVGAFELDCDQGAVLFRATNLFPKSAEIDEILTSLVQATVVETDTMTAFLSELNQLPLPVSSDQIVELLQRGDLMPDISPHLDAGNDAKSSESAESTRISEQK